ncbi:MAG: hypothetical protein ACRD0K_07325 [Egibacteraceae bacterium]
MSRGLKVLVSAVLAIVVIGLLFTVVFPWVDRLYVTNPVLDGG